MNSQPATLARITGRVQGVGFRMWTEQQALALGLTGWVRNETDGSVTALLAGPDKAVAAMVQKLHAGPRGAKVTGVRTEPAATGLAGGFRILG